MTVTPFQLEGLKLLGYTKRESEFLFLVATHSGYFTNHQFKCFAQTESGSVSHAFIQKLLNRKHATFHAYRSGERVYHLFARKVYQAIEQENLRTRKKHEIEYVKTRLVALDFVLAHPEHRYLETEPEKLRFFETESKLQRDVLPAKLYRARKSAEVTPRYFVDRFPMFLNEASSPPVLTFTYLDSGEVTLEGFATHLRGYMTLFRSLPRFDFVYIAPTARLFRAAESEFGRIVFSQRSEKQSVSVLDYFRLRSAWDRKERVASADVVALKEAQVRYAAKHFDELYERWRNGNVSDTEVAQFINQSSPAPNGAFRTLICGSSLKVFADPSAKMAESCPEGALRGSPPEISGSGSIAVSGS